MSVGWEGDEVDRGANGIFGAEDFALIGDAEGNLNPPPPFVCKGVLR